MVRYVWLYHHFRLFVVILPTITNHMEGLASAKTHDVITSRSFGMNERERLAYPSLNALKKGKRAENRIMRAGILT